MSRSHKKSPFIGYTCTESEAAWKAKAARAFRRAEYQGLRATLDGDALPAKRYAITNPWDGPKDGKQRLDDATSKYLRK